MRMQRTRIPRGYIILEQNEQRNRFITGRLIFRLILPVTLIIVAVLASQKTLSATPSSISNGLSTGTTQAMDGETESGHILMKDENGTTQRALHLSTNVDIEVNGMIAKVRYTQHFRNDSDRWQEATYTFPLAENAAVNYMEMTIGERRIVGQIKELAEAKRIYEQAKSAGKRAALTEQQRPNMFTQKVANIAPGEQISVNLEYVQLAQYQDGIFSFRLPTTFTPRYTPKVQTVSAQNLESESQIKIDSTSWGTAINQSELAAISPPMVDTEEGETTNPITIHVQINAGLPLQDISSPYHKISQRKVGDEYEAWFSGGTAEMDRDFVLNWQPETNDLPQAAVFREDVEDKTYLTMMLLPPQILSNDKRIPREMVFIIDTSGSMQGSSIAQAKRSLISALDRLQGGDKFNVIEFNSTHQALFSNTVSATPANLSNAKQFVSGLTANGGTNMQPALQTAMKYPSTESFVKQVVFITDGAVSNELELFNFIEDQLGGARLFTVGIGSAPNSYFMTKAAEFGRGTYTYIGKESEVQEKMSALFYQLESPVLTDLEITWSSAIEQYPARAPDLYFGSPVMVSVEAEQMPDQVVIRGHTADQAWERTISLRSTNSEPDSGVSTLWGRAKIASLMDEKIRGRDEAEVKKAVLDVALPHRLLSQYTSFVAVEQVMARSSEDRLGASEIHNAVANGQVRQQVSYPRTATWMLPNLLFGTLSLISFAALRYFSHSRRREWLAKTIYNLGLTHA